MYTLHDFCENMQMKGVKYIICTDISKDGALEGTNRAMYEKLTAKYKMRFMLPAEFRPSRTFGP